MITIGAWDEERHAALLTQLDAAVGEAVKQGEAVGTHGRSKPALSEMFEGVFAEPDWRCLEQRKEIGA